jgi:hypothetical protein
LLPRVGLFYNLFCRIVILQPSPNKDLLNPKKRPSKPEAGRPAPNRKNSQQTHSFPTPNHLPQSPPPTTAGRSLPPSPPSSLACRPCPSPASYVHFSRRAALASSSPARCHRPCTVPEGRRRPAPLQPPLLWSAPLRPPLDRSAPPWPTGHRNSSPPLHLSRSCPRPPGLDPKCTRAIQCPSIGTCKKSTPVLFLFLRIALELSWY